MKMLDRDLTDLVIALRSQLELTSTAFRELKYSKIIESGTWVIGAAGYVERDLNVPFSAVSVLSLSSQSVTITSQPAGNRPAQGRGVAELGAYGFGAFNLAGRVVTIYGNPGDSVVLTVLAQTIPPLAVPGAVTLTGTPAVSVPAAVTVHPPSTTDLYTESPTSRLVSGNTATLTLPAGASTAMVGVNITAFTGGTNVQFFLQEQDANGIWQGVALSNAMTATGGAAFFAGPGTSGQVMLRDGGPLRVQWFTSGTFSALTFQIAVSCR